MCEISRSRKTKGGGKCQNACFHPLRGGGKIQSARNDPPSPLKGKASDFPGVQEPLGEDMKKKFTLTPISREIPMNAGGKKTRRDLRKKRLTQGVILRYRFSLVGEEVYRGENQKSLKKKNGME